MSTLRNPRGLENVKRSRGFWRVSSESFHVDLSPLPLSLERQRPLPRNVLRRPSVSVAAAVGERQWRQKNRFLPNNPPVSIWANRCLWTWWFKDGLLWKRPRPAMRRHQFRFERTSLPLFSLLLSRATWNWFSWAFLDIYTVHWFYSSLWNTKDK